MARYRKLIVQGETGWYLMNPRNPWEAMKLAWYLWRHPDRVGALVGVREEFMLAKCKPESPNAKLCVFTQTDRTYKCKANFKTQQNAPSGYTGNR